MAARAVCVTGPAADVTTVADALLDAMKAGRGIEVTEELQPDEVAVRLSETFDPGGSIDYEAEPWAHRHAAAIDDARALLEAPLTLDVAREAKRFRDDTPVDRITPGEWCDLIEADLSVIRELEGAVDIDNPDDQARERLVRIAATALTCAQVLDAAKAKRERDSR